MIRGQSRAPSKRQLPSTERPIKLIDSGCENRRQMVFNPLCIGPKRAGLEYERGATDCKTAAKAVGVRLPPGPPPRSEYKAIGFFDRYPLSLATLRGRR